jgi:predicted GIY-YIG superfamily endonuclease
VPWVYILRCADSSLYVGHTADLEARERTHNDGLGATYTAQRRPVHVVYSEKCATLDDACEREHQLKRWSGVKKEALIAGDTERLKRLSNRTTTHA